MKDLSIDIETLSLKPNATILSIAAVLFDRESGDVGPHLHIACCFGQGRDIDWQVVDWWKEPQQAAAWAELLAFQKNQPYRLDWALEKLARFIRQHHPERIWGNSPSFDLVILTDAFRQHDIPAPWPFWVERDCRTLVNVCRQITGVDPKKQVAFDGTAHSALADAIYQARYASAAYRLLANSRNNRQAAILQWANTTFGNATADNTGERIRRLLEETVELAQALGLDASDINPIVGHVYAKPAGNIAQEIGQVGVSLLGLAEHLRISAEDEELNEFERIRSLPADYWQSRQNTKAEKGIARASSAGL